MKHPRKKGKIMRFLKIVQAILLIVYSFLIPPSSNNNKNLKNLVRMKTGGHGNLIDLEQSLLLLTY